MKTVWLLSGFKSSGKDTTASIIKEFYPSAKEYAYAEKIKKICSIVFNVPYSVMQGKTTEDRKKREELIPFWSDHIPGLTSRKALTVIGTDLFRNHFYDPIWAMTVVMEIINDDEPVSIVTDLREPDEEKITRELLKEKGFNVISVRVKREEPEWLGIAKKAWFDKCEESVKKLDDLQVHSSEWRQVGLSPDEVIYNDDLNYRDNIKRQIENIISKENL